MPDFEKGIVLVRFRHPTENRELEVHINEKDKAVDAVFTSVDAVEKILMPSFSARYPKEAPDLLKRVEAQRRGDNCFIIHKYSCRSAVPAIDWNAKAPIRLGPADWQPAERTER